MTKFAAAFRAFLRARTARAALGVLLGALPATGAPWAVCFCPAGAKCNIQGPDSDWTGADGGGGSCADGLTAADDVVGSFGSTVVMNASNTINTIEMRNGSIFACVNDMWPRVLTLDNSRPVLLGSGNVFFALAAGATMDCDGATGVEGNDLTITYSGPVPAGPAGAARFLAGDSPFSHFNLTTDAVWKQRGLRRLVGTVERVAGGARDDFVWCADLSGTVVNPVARGDTVVFTSGRLTDYWGRIDARPGACAGPANPDPSCTGAQATAECGPTACDGGPCDVQIDMNDTDRAFRSFVKVPGLGGPERQPTPDDTDADGVPDNDTMFPQDGDAVEVFKPSVIQGGANAITGGIAVYAVGVQANVRYLEVRGTVGAEASRICTSATPETSSALHLSVVKSIAPEGDLAFVNWYDNASIAFAELNATDRLEDARPNYPLILRHWYLHDTDANVPGTCIGDPGQRSGGGIVISTDNPGDTYRIDGLTLDGWHIARINAEVLNVSGPQAPTLSQYNDVTLSRVLVHDVPFSTTYGTIQTGILHWGHGANSRMLGIQVWDTGSDAAGPTVISVAPYAQGMSGAVKTGLRIQNAYIVNYDRNLDSAVGGADLTTGLAGPSINRDTAHTRIVDSYFAHGTGWVGSGGSWLRDFILNGNLDDDGAAPCAAMERGALVFPVDAIGNVITNTSAIACWSAGLFSSTDLVGQPLPFATRKRQWLSNVITPPNPNANYVNTGIRARGIATSDMPGFNVANNLIDLGDVDGIYEGGVVVSFGSGFPAFSSHHNIIMRSRSTGIINPSMGRFDSGHNHFSRIAGNHYFSCSGACTGGADGLYPGDVDEGDDLLVDLSGDFRDQLCDAVARDGRPAGPLAFGIRDFTWFHPAVLAAMDPLAFQMRYDRLLCTGPDRDAPRR